MNPVIKRKHTRYTPSEKECIALIDTSTDSDSGFDHSISALIFSEASGGCGLVVRNTESLHVGSHCKIKIAQLAPIKAEVVWRKPIDDDLIKIGFKFLE
jgi:hypothetical protein